MEKRMPIRRWVCSGKNMADERPAFQLRRGDTALPYRLISTAGVKKTT